MKLTKLQVEERLNKAIGKPKESDIKTGIDRKKYLKDATDEISKGGKFQCENYKCKHEWKGKPYEIPEKCPKCGSNLVSLALKPEKTGIKRRVGFYNIEEL